MSVFRDPTAPSDKEVGLALDRLIDDAQGNHGGAVRTVDFLLAWWNGPEYGDFPITHLASVDRRIARDMVLIMRYLAGGPMQYPYYWGRRADIEKLIVDWRNPPE